ncbi:MAG: DMT family transporter [Flavobacteriales bacterium]|nr:DMT family transporter [Flavobacteriales bacterium]
MSLIDLEKKSWQWVLLIFLSFIWGSSFILMKRGLEVYSFEQVAALRIGISSLCLLPFFFQNLKSLNRGNWSFILLVAVLGNLIPSFLFTKAQTQLSSSLTGMLNALVPFFTILIGYIFKIKVPENQLIGVLIGFIGACLIIGSNGFGVADSQLSYTLYIIAATICYAISINTTKYKLAEVGSMAIMSLGMVMIGPFIIGFIFTTDFVEVTINNPGANRALAYIVALSILGTVIAVILYYMLIKKTSAIFAASVTYMIPLVAIFWGVLDGESINTIQFVGTGVVFLGVYTISTKKKESAKTD